MPELFPNYSEALKLFVGEDDRREWMNTPFKQNVFYYATDSVGLIEFPISVAKIECPELLSSKVNIKKAIQNQCKPLAAIIFIEELKQQLIPQMIEEEIEVLERCDACKGKMEVQYEFTHKGKDYHTTEACPVCEGYGETKTGTEKTGKMIVNQGAIYKLFSHYITYFNLNRLVKACEYLQIEKIYYAETEPLQPAIFKSNEISILLMPLTSAENEPTIKLTL